MFFLKLAIGVLAVATVTFAARQKCKKLYLEYAFFNALTEYLKAVKSSVGYKKAKISEITVDDEEFKGFLCDFSHSGNPSDLNVPDYLTEAEKLKISAVFSLIVSSDAITLREALNGYIDDFTDLAEEKRQNYVKRKPVYLKVGFSVGLMLLIMVM